MKKICLGIILALSIIAFSNIAQAQPKGRLIVFTTDYCPYCAAFMSDVGTVYAKTKIGEYFPLTVVDNHTPTPEFEDLAWEIRFYPTFLVYDTAGNELARFRGYRGEESFWGDMESLLSKLPQ